MIKLVRQNFQKNKGLFNKIKNQLLLVLDKSAKIDHVGSTAIPNMYGKNIIDALVGVSNFESLKLFAQKIEDLGFYPSNKNDINSGYLFFASSKSETKDGDVHIHLVITSIQRYDDFILLKKYLLNHPDEAKKYREEKYKIAKSAQNQRENYKLLKSQYVDNLLIMARNEQ